MLSWSFINEESPRHGEEAESARLEDEDGQLPRETNEAREARHNSLYKQALALHGEGSPHSDAWAKAKQLYDTVISDNRRPPAERKRASAAGAGAAFDTPVRFLCLKNLADMVEREGDDARALELQVAAAEEDGSDLAVWMKMARLSRAAGLSNLARLALERLLEANGDHLLALRTLKDLLSEIGDVAACREVTARLLDLDPYGDSPSSTFGVRTYLTTNSHTEAGEAGARANSQDESQQHRSNRASPGATVGSSSFCLERTLDLPSWERLGALLIDIRASIVHGKRHDAARPSSVAASAANPSATAGENRPTRENGAAEGEHNAASTETADVATVATGMGVADGGSGGAGASGIVSKTLAVPPLELSPPPTLSTPVRIVLGRLHDAEDVVVPATTAATEGVLRAGPDATAGGGGGGGGGGSGGGDENGGVVMKGTVAALNAVDGADRRVEEQQEEQAQELRQQQHHRRLRRPSVERAMDWYSDGSSSSDEEDDEGGDGDGEGKGKGKGKLDQSAEWAERRTSARRQKQEETREADVAAARQDDVEFRVVSMFSSPGDSNRNGNGSADGSGASALNGHAESERQKQEGQQEEHAWWPRGVGGGIGRGAVASGAGGAGAGAEGPHAEEGNNGEQDEEKEAALAAKMLPRWRRRHDVDCRRCGEGGIVLCCDFCHLVYHPSCLEVTPGLTSLFACSDCKEEAAILEWELKGRDAASGAVAAGGLQELLRAADGRRGNAGVVDLMLRWLKGVTSAPPEDLCLEAAFSAADNRARAGGGTGGGASSVFPSAAFNRGYQLAAVALAVEPIVRGYLPTHLTWPALLMTGSATSPAVGMSAAHNGGPELGLACELALVEMRVDKALYLLQQRQQQQQRPPGGSKSNAHGGANGVGAGAVPAVAGTTPSAITAAAGGGGAASGTGSAGAPASSVASATTAGGAAAGSGKSDGPSGGDAGSAGRIRTSAHEYSRRSPGELAREAAENLAAADAAMLELEPWCTAVEKSLDDAGDPSRGGSNAVPWVMVVRWWWLKAVRSRQAGQAKAALRYLRRCEKALHAGYRERESRVKLMSAFPHLMCAWNSEVAGAGSPEVARGSTFTSLSKRPVVRGFITDVELSGTSEAAREAFSSAILLFAVAPAGKSKSQVGATEASETVIDGTPAPSVVGPAERVSTALVPLAQPLSFTGGVGGAGAQGGNARSEAIGTGDSARSESSAVAEARARPNGAGTVAGGAGTAGGSSLSPSAQRDQAIQALVGVMRGLEDRFVARALAAPPSQRLLSSHKPAVAESIDARSGDTATASSATSTSTAGSRGGGRGWTVRIRPSRAEELLSDLLEREKASLSQVSRDGTRTLERRAAVTRGKERVPPDATAPPFFLARTSPTAATAAAAATATPVVVALAGGRPPAISRDIQLLLRRRRRQHFPLELSGVGLGEKNSVFSMMIRGASLLGRHETAVLLAVRCAEHFLESSDVLASPRGPLGLGGVGAGAGSPGKGNRRGGVGGRGNEGLGAVHLLLTTRAPGADRRRVDAAATSACAEFLAYSLAVVLWAVPYTARQKLRASVQRCLARLMKHSMRSDSTRVLNLCVIAWQAIATVVSARDDGPAQNTAERVNSAQARRDAGVASVGEEGASYCRSGETKTPGSSNGDGGNDGKDHVQEDTVSRCDAFAVDALRDLVRCLCGVVVGRWKQASTTTAKAPKKVWVVHAMEAVHALVRTLEFQHSIGYSNAAVIPASDPDGGNFIAKSTCPGDHGGLTITSSAVGTDAPRRSSFFSNPSEIREVVEALMGLSQLPDAPNTALKLTCSLAILAVGLSDTAAPLDAERRVGLVMALHDYLKGKLGAAAVTLGDALQGQAGYGGVCADGEGAFLKPALLYLSSQQVASAVKMEEDEARLASGTGSSNSNDTGDGNDSAFPASDDDDDGDDDDIEIDVEGAGVVNASGSDGGDVRDAGDGGGGSVGSHEAREMKALDSYNRTPEGKRHRDGYDEPAPSGGGRGKGQRPRRRRADRLSERVLRAMSQCQACLYDIAMVPCEDHRCFTPPSRPSTALEAHALYVCWESRLPDLRRSYALRLLEAVATQKAFSSPPRTGFSKAVERHLFLAWLPQTAAVPASGIGKAAAGDKNGLGARGETDDRSSRGSGIVSGSLALPFLRGRDLRPSGASSLVEMDVEGGEGTRGGSPGGEEGLGSTVAAAAGAAAGATAKVGDAGSSAAPGGNGSAATMGTAASAAGKRSGGGGERRAREDGTDARRGEARGADHGRSTYPDGDARGFQRVYRGFYKNLVEAKGVPSGFKSCTTKSMDEVSDTETFLMQGIRWRVLDLSFCPDRMSSWKGLAQCACRLAALYLDAFPPSCHRLGMPLTATAAARAAAAAAAASSRAGQPPPRSPGPRTESVREVEPTDASEETGSSGHAFGAPAPTGAEGAAPSINADAEMLDVASAGGDGGKVAAVSSEKGNGAGGGVGIGVEGDGASNATPVMAKVAAIAMEVDGALPLQERGVKDAGTSGSAIDLSGDAPATAPTDALSIVTGSVDAGNQPGESGPTKSVAASATADNTAVTAPVDAASGRESMEAPIPSAAPPSLSTPAQPSGDKDSSGRSSSHSTGSDHLGKRRRSTVMPDCLFLETSSELPPGENDASEVGGSDKGCNSGGLSQIPQREENAASDVLGLRGIPGPDLSPFFRGSALDAKAARKDGDGGGGPRRGTRLAAIVQGLRRMGTPGARSTAEAAAAAAIATRVADGNATQEEWAACLGHASIAAAVGTAERAFCAWKALAEDSLSKARGSAVGPGGVGGEVGRQQSEAGGTGEWAGLCEAAARDVAECCEEEAFLKFMLARDVWPGNEDRNAATVTGTAATSASPPTACPVSPARIPAGLEEGGRERLLESSLALLRRAQRLRDTGGKLRSSGSPVPSAPRSPKVLLSDSSLAGGGSGDVGSRETSAARKRRRLSDASAASGATGRRSPVGGRRATLAGAVRYGAALRGARQGAPAGVGEPRGCSALGSGGARSS
ncbi:unnamed protein product [Scytosiphon promiscuus]